MGIPRLLILKQLISNSTVKSLLTLSKSPIKPHLILPIQFTRTYNTQHSTVSSDNNLQSEIIKFVKDSPNNSVVPLLVKCVEQGNSIVHDELKETVRKLHRRKLFERALEVSEWVNCKSTNNPDSDLLATQLDLIDRVCGVDAAERFFNEVNDHSERMYATMLNSYVKAGLEFKSLSHFKKMKDEGFATNPHTYNTIMSLYMNCGQVEKVLELLSEMEDNGVPPNEVSYRMGVKSCGLRSDFECMEKLLKTMECQPHVSMDWFTYATIANYFIGGGQKEKAVYCLQKAEERVHDNAVGYNNLITMYAKLRDVAQVKRMWQKHQAACESQSNADYMVMIGALVKLDEFKEAERLLQEWESVVISAGNIYDFRVPNVLLVGYTEKGQIDQAEKMLEGFVGKEKTLVPNTWIIMSEGYLKCQNMGKAVQCLTKALELAPQHQGWVPKRAVVRTILNWLGDNANIDEINEFLKLLSKVVPMNKKMYHSLLKAYIRNGKETDDIVARMMADNVEFDEELCKIVGSSIES